VGSVDIERIEALWVACVKTSSRGQMPLAWGFPKAAEARERRRQHHALERPAITARIRLAACGVVRYSVA